MEAITTKHLVQVVDLDAPIGSLQSRSAQLSRDESAAVLNFFAQVAQYGYEVAIFREAARIESVEPRHDCSPNPESLVVQLTLQDMGDKLGYDRRTLTTPSLMALARYAADLDGDSCHVLGVYCATCHAHLHLRCQHVALRGSEPIVRLCFDIVSLRAVLFEPGFWRDVDRLGRKGVLALRHIIEELHQD